MYKIKFKKMKGIAILVVLLLMSGLVVAQNKDRKQHQELKIEKMKKELNLSDSQVKEMEERREAVEKVLQDEKLTREEKRAKIMEMRRTQKEILTEEQQETMKTKRMEKSADRVIRVHERKEKREKLKTLRAEFNSQISQEDQAVIASIKKEMKARRNQEEQGKKGIQESDRKQLKAISLKYDDRVKAFLKDNDVQEMGKHKKGKSVKPMRHEKGLKNKRGGAKGHTTKFLLMDF